MLTAYSLTLLACGWSMIFLNLAFILTLLATSLTTLRSITDALHNALPRPLTNPKLKKPQEYCVLKKIKKLK